MRQDALALPFVFPFFHFSFSLREHYQVNPKVMSFIWHSLVFFITAVTTEELVQKLNFTHSTVHCHLRRLEKVLKLKSFVTITTCVITRQS